MAKMYYTLEEAIERLGCSEDEIREYVRNGKLREFRDAGKVNYRVDDVDKLAAPASGTLSLEDSGELSLEDSQEISLSPEGSGAGDKAGSGSAAGLSGSAAGLSGSGMGLEDSDAPIDLSGSDTGTLSLEGSAGGGLQLEDSGAQPSPQDSDLGGDVLNLDEVDKDAVEGMKKDDTVITNIGISVFDEDDLEISADPMAKTVMTDAEESLGLDGSTAGSGLLDLTRESDDTSLGAELLEGIDMGDTAETVMKTVSDDEGESVEVSGDAGLPEPELGPALAGPTTLTVAAVPASSPAFAGLLIAAAISMTLTAAAAIAMVMGAWPGYLNTLAQQFWFLLGGCFVLGGISAGIGHLVGRPATPKTAKPKKEKKAKKGKKGKKGKAAAGEAPSLDDEVGLS